MDARLIVLLLTHKAKPLVYSHLHKKNWHQKHNNDYNNYPNDFANLFGTV